MKPERSILPEREPVAPEPRRVLTRRETIELAVRQNGRCGCGCGEKLDALREGVTDEHVIALDHGGTNDLSNRSLWRTPCSRKKTAEQDAPATAKGRRLRGETGQRKRREARGGSSIKGGGFQTPPEGYRHQWAKRPFRKSPETPHDH